MYPLDNLAVGIVYEAARSILFHVGVSLYILFGNLFNSVCNTIILNIVNQIYNFYRTLQASGKAKILFYATSKTVFNVFPNVYKLSYLIYAKLIIIMIII